MVRHRQIPNLRRTTGTKSAKKKFILFCEGQNAEPHYFLALRSRWCGALIEVETIPGAGVPKTIADRATERFRTLRGEQRKNADSFEFKDEVWAVFDRDDHPHFDEAITKCESNGVNVARSNPCFEVWLILHLEDFQRPDSRQAVQRHLEKICPNYVRDHGKTPHCQDLIQNLNEAENRAERQLSKREEEGNPFGPPSTTVFELTRKIRLANDRKP